MKHLIAQELQQLGNELLWIFDRAAPAFSLSVAVVAWSGDYFDTSLKILSLITGLVTLLYLTLRCYYLIKNKGK